MSKLLTLKEYVKKKPLVTYDIVYNIVKKYKIPSKKLLVSGKERYYNPLQIDKHIPKLKDNECSEIPKGYMTAPMVFKEIGQFISAPTLHRLANGYLKKNGKFLRFRIGNKGTCRVLPRGAWAGLLMYANNKTNKPAYKLARDILLKKEESEPSGVIDPDKIYTPLAVSYISDGVLAPLYSMKIFEMRKSMSGAQVLKSIEKYLDNCWESPDHCMRLAAGYHKLTGKMPKGFAGDVAKQILDSIPRFEDKNSYSSIEDAVTAICEATNEKKGSVLTAIKRLLSRGHEIRRYIGIVNNNGSQKIIAYMPEVAPVFTEAASIPKLFMMNSRFDPYGSLEEILSDDEPQ